MNKHSQDGNQLLISKRHGLFYSPFPHLYSHGLCLEHVCSLDEARRRKGSQSFSVNKFLSNVRFDAALFFFFFVSALPSQ